MDSKEISIPHIPFRSLNAVAVLQVHEVVAQTAKRFCIAVVPFVSQILADQIEHGGEGPEIVVRLECGIAGFDVPRSCSKYDAGELNTF